MEIETPQIYSTYQHIFEFPHRKCTKMLLNELYPTKAQRHAPAIIILGTEKPFYRYTKNLNLDLEKIFLEHGDCKVFFRFINSLKLDNFKHLLENQLVYQGRQ